MEFNQEAQDPESNEETGQGKTKQWLQDNLRIIISVLIVVLIAGGIYSYSRRTEAPIAPEVSENGIISEEEGDAIEIAGEEGQEVKLDETAPQAPVVQDSAKDQTSSVATSQETENSFVETAGRGDSKTTLARAALANFLEKNPDSGLTPEHKIYIEDYLRKNVSGNDRVFVGTSVEFQKNLIQDAISKSKNLTENQLNNLHKYAIRVPSLS